MAQVSYEQGHLVVAAVRVLTHLNERPPTVEAIAELIDVPPEAVRPWVSALDDKGIVKTLTTAFEVRVEVADYHLIEDLPREKEMPAMAEEMDQFVHDSREKHRKLEELFSTGEIEKRKKKRFSKMEDDLKKMSSRRVSPFAEDTSTDDKNTKE